MYPWARRIPERQATVEPLPFVPATMMQRDAGGSRSSRRATPATRSSPRSMREPVHAFLQPQPLVQTASLRHFMPDASALQALATSAGRFCINRSSRAM